MQAYCLNDQTFLPDRYLTGTCKKCGYGEARSDECPQCGSWLSFDDIKDPKCAICGKSNIETREVKHWYFDLPKLAPKIQKWLQSQTRWKENVRNYALSLLKGIPERAVTRNVKWGVDLPKPFYEEGKKIYVWFEAPIGYLTNLQEWNQKWETYWASSSEMIHFIGKDNIIFHTIIWPAMLMAADERLPTNVPANMFVQLQKKQFSKSSGWYVDAQEALKDYGVDRLRYYLTTIIPEVQDTNFDWRIFREKVNAELVNKIANLFNRVGSQIKKHFDGKLSPEDCKQFPPVLSAHSKTLEALENFEFNSALSQVVQLSEEANKYLDNTKPWNVVREDKERARSIFGTVSHYMISIAALLQPFLPTFSDRILNSFSIPKDHKFRSKLYQKGGKEVLLQQGLTVHPESNFIVTRIETDKIEAEIKKLKRLKG